jgi:peroxiredoxin Q/BCP
LGCRLWQTYNRPAFFLECVMRGALLVIFIQWLTATNALAALDVGETAPDFTTPAALAGKPYSYSLKASLSRGPVVLYFFPAAFTEGCSIEAQQFAQAIPQFEALGASVIGVSGDDIETLAKFSLQVCQGKFPVASDTTRTIIKSYDAAMKSMPDFATRVSYVIAPSGSIVYHYLSLNPNKHVENTLAAVRDWSRAKSIR